MKSNQINIGAGTTWNVHRGSNAASYFPDVALPRHLGRTLRNADSQGLLASLSREPISNSGVAVVRSVTSDPSLVVKLSREPFSHTAVNVLLEKAWANNPQYNTPRYLGHMITPGFNATVMSRADGIQIADLQPSLSLEQLEDVGERIKFSGGVAIAGYGIDPGLIAWDLNTRNIMHDRQRSLQPDSPLTVIDQGATAHLGPNAWNDLMAQQGDIVRDPRDINAADSLAEQDAFDRFFANR